MKKALSLLLSLLMLVSLLIVPVSAGPDDGFNDGQFGEWGDGETPVDPPVEPSEGTLENPIYVPMGMAAPKLISLAAGESVYYQLNAPVFNGYSVIASLPSAVTVDGVRYDTYSPIDYGIKVVLEFTPMSPAIVGFHNETEEDMPEIVLDWKMPEGTESDPYQLQEGDNAISIPTNYTLYYASYIPTAEGDYTLSASDYENFIIIVDTDSDLATTEDQFQLTQELVYNITSEYTYMPLFFMVQPIGVTPDITLSIAPPAKGTEANPYWLGGYEEILAGVDGISGLWPATPYETGVYYSLNGAYDGYPLLVTGTAPLSVTVNGSTWTKTTGDQVTLEIPLELGETDWTFNVLVKGGSDVKFDIVFPEGDYNNPQVLNKGKNTLPLPEGGNSYYATYTAEKDGVLVMKPNTVNGLGYTDAFNATLGDYENGYDFISAGWMDDDGVIQGASEDNVLKIPVSKGDVVNITSCSVLENDDFEIMAMDLTLTVAYEGENAVEITNEPATAAYAKEGAKVSVKIAAKGDGLKYQWYIKNANGTKYSKSSVTSATYSTTMSDKAHGRRIYCVVTDQYGNEVQSKTFILRRQASITKEPATAAYAQMGKKVSVKITALGDNLTYQWYLKNANGTKYSKSSITSATYSATMSDKVKGRRIYCIVKDKYGKTVQSKTFILRESVSITKEPSTATYAKNGATAKVTIKASGDGLKYQWYIKNAGGTKYSKSSITSATYSVKMSDKVHGRRLYCVVTDKYGNVVQTKTMILKKK